MTRRSLALGVTAAGGLAGLAAWTNQGTLGSLAVRAISRRLPNAATRRDVGVSLGPARGRWTKLTLAADLGQTLSEVCGTPIEAAAYSRFGGFEPGRRYSAFLDPTSPYYQAWLGAYVVFDRPESAPFGFEPSGDVRPEAVLDVLEADQRLVYRSLGCVNRFPDGRHTRGVGPIRVETIKVDETLWWRLTGEAETWSTYCRGGSPDSLRRAKLLYGVVPEDAPFAVEDFHPLRYAGEFWLRHDPLLRATCAAFLVAPRRGPERLSSSDPLLVAARSLLRQVRFSPQR